MPDLAVICDASPGEPGSLAWAGLMPIVPPLARVVAYDRAGIGASDPGFAADTGLPGRRPQRGNQRNRTNPPCILVGHSLGGLLVQLAALMRPELVAGMVLVDPAEEQYLAALPAEELQQGITLGESVISQHADGTLPGTIRVAFAGHAQHLTDDPQLQDLILDAYVYCYATPTQARMIRDEHQLAIRSLPQIRRLRAEGTLPSAIWSSSQRSGACRCSLSVTAEPEAVSRTSEAAVATRPM